jgi:hypothetical protein
MTSDGHVFEALSDVRDELQRVNQVLAALCQQQGIDFHRARLLPGEGMLPLNVAPGGMPERM